MLEGLFIISGKASQIINGIFNINAVPPEYSSVSQGASVIERGTPIALSAYWSGNAPLDYSWLATNETGAWENKTGIYGSPLKMSGYSGWSNFTWNNPSFLGIVYWVICANVTSGNINCTPAMSFQVVEGAPAAPAGGGGGAALPPKIANFTVDREFLKISAKQGETVLDHLKINNTGETALSFNMTVENMNKSVMLSEDSFALGAGESKTITVAFTAKEDTIPEIYAGRLIITAGNMTKSVMLIMEVKPRKSMFDLYVSLPETPLVSVRGEEVEADILMYNFGETRPLDIILYYSLRDFDGRDIIFNHETITVEEQKLIKRKVRIPADQGYGFYLFYARLEYSNQTATSSSLIKVVEKEEIKEAEPYLSYWISVGFAAAAIISLLMLALLMHSVAAKRKRMAKEKPSARLKEMKKDIESLRLALRLGSMEEGGARIRKDIENLKTLLKPFVRSRYFEKEVIARNGKEKEIEISFRNEKEAARSALSIEDLPPSWFSVYPKSVQAGSGKDVEFRVIFKIPMDAKGVYPFFYAIKIGRHQAIEAASLIVAETEKEMLTKELERISRKVSELEKYYG